MIFATCPDRSRAAERVAGACWVGGQANPAPSAPLSWLGVAPGRLLAAGDFSETGHGMRPCPLWWPGRRAGSMTSPLTMTLYRPRGQLGSYVRAFQVLSTTEPAAVSVLDFGGGDVSVPVCFGDPVLVEDWGRAEVPSAAVVGPRR